MTGKSTFTNLADADDPAQEPRRHRAVGQPGRDHRAAARRAAHHARRRSARDRAGRRHQPAQRRRQSQSVLPARLQSRSRHRLRDDGRRHAGQHADARARPWLFGSELPDSRSWSAACSSRRARTSPIRETSPRPARRTSTTRTRSTARSCASAAAARASARAACRGLAAVGRGPPAGGARSAAQRRTVGRGPTTSARSTASCATARATRSNGFRSPAWAIAARGTRPTRFRARAVDDGLDRPLRHDRHDRRRRHRIATAARSSGSGRAATPARSSRPSASATTSNLFSNFTFFLDDPVNGDQFQQADHRFVSGAQASPIAGSGAGPAGRCRTRSALQLRNDDIANVGLYHTARAAAARHRARGRGAADERRPATRRTKPSGRRGCARWPACASTAIASTSTPSDPANCGHRLRRARQPEGRRRVRAVAAAPSSTRTPGSAFTATTRAARRSRVDPATGEPADRVTPLARAQGRGGRRAHASRFRTCRRAVALWTLSLDSELIFVGDAGTTEAGRPSHRYGIEWANYYSPRPWLTFDGDVVVSRAHFTDDDPAGAPSRARSTPSSRRARPWTAVHDVFGSVRWRYFGPRPLIEDDSVRSRADEPRQPRGGLPVHEPRCGSPSTSSTCSTPRTATSTTSTLAPARRAGRGRRRHPLPSDVAAHGQGQPDGGDVTSVTCLPPKGGSYR